MERFDAALRAGDLPISLEITPPRPPLPARRTALFRRAAGIEGLASALNVIQRPDRVDSLEACVELLEAGLDPFWHLTSRGRTRAAIAADLQRAAAVGIRRLLCLRGDHGAPDASTTPTLRECVSLAVERLPNALIGVTAHQHAPRDRVLRNLLPKLDAGAHLVQTQPVFEVSAYASLVERVKRSHPEVYCMPIVMPLVRVEDAEAVRKRVGVPVPDRLVSDLSRDGGAAGWSFFGDTLRALQASGLADAVAVMTLRMDPTEPFLDRLRGELRALYP